MEGVPSKVATLMVGAILLLLIGVANVASIILARLGGEEAEIAVRVALGAGRGELVRRQVADGLIVAVIGSAAGIW